MSLGYFVNHVIRLYIPLNPSLRKGEEKAVQPDKMHLQNAPSICSTHLIIFPFCIVLTHGLVKFGHAIKSTIYIASHGYKV